MQRLSIIEPRTAPATQQLFSASSGTSVSSSTLSLFLGPLCFYQLQGSEGDTAHHQEDWQEGAGGIDEPVALSATAYTLEVKTKQYL